MNAYPLKTAPFEENWFFYWKTAVSLWRAKLESFPSYLPVLVPINWAFHQESLDSFDFGGNRPETDLVSLCDLAHELNRKVIFFIPLTPVPYLVNGGVPHFYARVPSRSQYGVYQVSFSDGQIFKFHSFFDTRIYQGLTKFMRDLSAYFISNDLEVPIYGMECGAIEKANFKSFFEDYSQVFRQAYVKYLNLSSDTKDIKETKQSVKEFRETILSLYRESAGESFGPLWKGVKQIAFIGARQSDFIVRLDHKIELSHLSSEILDALSVNAIPTLMLLSLSERSKILEAQMLDLVYENLTVSSFLTLEEKEEQSLDETSFKELTFFEFFLNGVRDQWEDSGLYRAIQKKYARIIKKFPLSSLSFKEENKTVIFYQAENLDESSFKVILNTFMHSGRIVLDISYISEEFRRRFETFTLENNLKRELLSLKADVEVFLLGDGRLFFLNSKELEVLSASQKEEFWNALFRAFHFENLPIPPLDGLESFWRSREAKTSELEFQEIRRLTLYNPSSYKKKLKIDTPKNFVLNKIMSDSYVSVQNKSKQLYLDFLPMGHVSLDFGVLPSGDNQ